MTNSASLLLCLKVSALVIFSPLPDGFFIILSCLLQAIRRTLKQMKKESSRLLKNTMGSAQVLQMARGDTH